MADRNRELVPDNWSLVRERALTTGHTHTTEDEENRHMWREGLTDRKQLIACPTASGSRFQAGYRDSGMRKSAVQRF